ncbi:MAG TPA: ATP-binding protein [Prosthecobacter sp.]
MSTPTPAQEIRSIANDILEWAETSDISKAELLRQHPALGSDKTLLSISKGQTSELDLDKWLPAYRGVLQAIIPEAEEEADPLYEDLSTTWALRREFTRLKVSRTNAKLIIVEGITGMGKTSSGRIIAKKMRDLNAVSALHSVEASAGWGDRPNAMISAILRVLGIQDSGRSQAARLEKLLEALNAHPCVILVDEVHDVAGRCLRVLKTILNQSPTKIVLLTHPRLFRDLERENWDDVSQLTGNRLLARINLGEIQAADVALILKRRLPALNGDTDTAAKTLAAAAKANGNFAFVREVVIRLKKHQAKTKTDTLTLADVDTATRAELKARRASTTSL